MHRSLLKRFPLFGFCLPVSSVPNFRPDTGGRRWYLVQVRLFGRAAGREGSCFPVYAAQAPSRSIWSMPCVACVPVFRYSTKARTRLRLRFVHSPAQAAQAARSLMGPLSPGVACLLTSAVPAFFHQRQSGACTFSPPPPQPQSLPAPVRCVRPVSSCDPPSGCRPSRISGSLWLETGGLFAVQ